MKKRTLVDRMIARDKALANDAYTPVGHIRAELNRLARQVRRLKENRSHMQCDYTWALSDVLALIKEAKK